MNKQDLKDMFELAGVDITKGKAKVLLEQAISLDDAMSIEYEIQNGGQSIRLSNSDQEFVFNSQEASQLLAGKEVSGFTLERDATTLSGGEVGGDNIVAVDSEGHGVTLFVDIRALQRVAQAA